LEPRPLLLVSLLVTLFALFAPAFAAGATEKILYTFQGPDGSTPEAGMIFDAAGNLYGTTYFGGAPNACFASYGCGTIFRLTPNPDGTWSETVLHSFDLNNGAYPDQNLIFDAAGNLLGAASVGGDAGVAFELMPGPGGWNYSVIHQFVSDRHDGVSPESILFLDATGNLFGTTAGGGTRDGGTVYELSPAGGGSWTESILVDFNGNNAAPGGNGPAAGFIEDAAGNLYGTTSAGGNPVCAAGCGTIFELSPNGDGTWTKLILHRFNGADGAMPVADLVADGSGNLYGTATEGGGGLGCFAGCGTLFKLAKTPAGSWKLSVLHTFKNYSGGSPETRLVFDSKGNLYGTTIIGGLRTACPIQHGCGVVFKLSPSPTGTWKYSVLYKFQNGADGALPAGIVRDQAGNIYGTTRWGGANGLGTIFEITP
jgi:uncharacterized repeat protein (TIGR03803 family)